MGEDMWVEYGDSSDDESDSDDEDSDDDDEDSEEDDEFLRLPLDDRSVLRR